MTVAKLQPAGALNLAELARRDRFTALERARADNTEKLIGICRRIRTVRRVKRYHKIPELFDEMERLLRALGR